VLNVGIFDHQVTFVQKLHFEHFQIEQMFYVPIELVDRVRLHSFFVEIGENALFHASQTRFHVRFVQHHLIDVSFEQFLSASRWRARLGLSRCARFVVVVLFRFERVWHGQKVRIIWQTESTDVLHGHKFVIGLFATVRCARRRALSQLVQRNCLILNGHYGELVLEQRNRLIVGQVELVRLEFERVAHSGRIYVHQIERIILNRAIMNGFVVRSQETVRWQRVLVHKLSGRTDQIRIVEEQKTFSIEHVIGRTGQLDIGQLFEISAKHVECCLFFQVH